MPSRHIKRLVIQFTIILTGSLMKIVKAYPIVLGVVCKDTPLLIDMDNKRIIKNGLAKGTHYRAMSVETGCFYGWLLRKAFVV